MKLPKSISYAEYHGHSDESNEPLRSRITAIRSSSISTNAYKSYTHNTTSSKLNNSNIKSLNLHSNNTLSGLRSPIHTNRNLFLDNYYLDSPLYTPGSKKISTDYEYDDFKDIELSRNCKDSSKLNRNENSQFSNTGYDSDTTCKSKIRCLNLSPSKHKTPVRQPTLRRCRSVHNKSYKSNKYLPERTPSLSNHYHDERLMLKSKFDRSAFYRKKKIFDFFDRPTCFARWIYHIPLFLLFLTCLILHIITTTNDNFFETEVTYSNGTTTTVATTTVSILTENQKSDLDRCLFLLELFICVLVTVEFMLRLWSAGCRSRYQGWRGRLKFCCQFFCILDIVIVSSQCVIFIYDFNKDPDDPKDQNVEKTGAIYTFGPTALRMLRFLVVIRMVRVDRRGNSWKLLSSVVKAHSRELMTTWYIGWLLLLLCSFLVYQCEKNENQEFGNLAQSIWWGFITLATIGYGDKKPQTVYGQIVTVIFANFTVAFFALPAGILGTGFALKVQEQNRVKHFARRRVPAAILIQSAWRCYASGAETTYRATWNAAIRNVPQNPSKNTTAVEMNGTGDSVTSALAGPPTGSKLQDNQSVLSLSVGRVFKSKVRVE